MTIGSLPALLPSARDARFRPQGVPRALFPRVTGARSLRAVLTDSGPLRAVLAPGRR